MDGLCDEFGFNLVAREPKTDAEYDAYYKVRDAAHVLWEQYLISRDGPEAAFQQ